MAVLRNLLDSSASSAKQLLSASNKARDGKDWLAAAESYRDYLEVMPNDAGVWVQYGHALKEHGRLTDAEAAYRQAANLDPADADCRLHLAHLLKRLDRPRQAAIMFREVLARAPTAEVVAELQSAGYDAEVRAVIESRPAQAKQRGCYVELKDLFQYLSLHTTVTGITRVSLGLVNHILEDMDETAAATHHFVHQYGDAEGVLLIPKIQMRRIVQMAMSSSPDLTAMQTLIGNIRATSVVTQLQKGDAYMIVGAFWEFVANPSWLNGMKQRGVLIGAYIYDLIPLTHAQYCMSALTDAFGLAFAETVRLLDFAVTISAFVARQVTDYVALHHIATFPTVPVLLAHELRLEVERHRERVITSSKLDVLDGIPFVLCVCTIEARKNHIYLFYVWQRMIAAGLDVPDLVFVGRPGWRVQDLMDQINASRFLGGQLHIMNGLSDEDLEALYDRCLFTVFPSFVEGWGLPVGESLARGKVCVASSTTSIPEIGGDLVVYIDPFNLESGYETISGLIKDPGKLQRLEDKLRKSFTPRTWKDVGQDFFAKVDRLMADISQRSGPRDLYAPTLAPGDMFDVATMENLGARGAVYVANPERLAFAEGWRGVEATGTWMRDPQAKLRLRTGCKPGEPLHVLLHLGASPWVRPDNTLRVSASGALVKRREKESAGVTQTLRPDRDFWIRLQGIVDEAGCLTIHIRVDGAIHTPDQSHVPVAVRLHAAGYAKSSDILSRLNLLEQALL